MSEISSTPKKRGPKPSGRVTRMVTLRMEDSLRRELRDAVTPERTQTAIVESALRRELHPDAHCAR